MKPIRILHVVTVMNTGGIETLLMNIYRNIDRNKIQFDFLTHREEEGFYDDEIRQLGGRIYNVPPINPLKHRKYINELNKFFEKHPEYQIVHSHINTFSMYPLRASMKAGVSTRIAHSHIAFPKYDYKAPFKMYTKKYLKDFCTNMFACSKLAGEWLYGKRNENYIVVNNAVDTDKFKFDAIKREQKRSEFSIQNKFVLGHIGRFNVQKNHSFILDTFKLINEIEPNSILLLIGEGELKSSIEEKIKKLGLNNNVILTGARSDVEDIIQAMDVFIFPSLYEGLPVTLIEAQCSGLPCIVSENVTKEVQITDLITYLPLKENADEWARHIIKYKNFERRSYKKEIHKAGYDILSVCTWLEEFYVKEYSLKNE